LDETNGDLVLMLLLVCNFDPFHTVRKDRNQGKWRIYSDYRGWRICFPCMLFHRSGREDGPNRDGDGNCPTWVEYVHKLLQMNGVDEWLLHVEYSYCRDRNRDT